MKTDDISPILEQTPSGTRTNDMPDTHHDPKDAIALLKRDHKVVRDLLAQMDKTTSRFASKRALLLETIARAVRDHAQIEETIFYPAYHAAAKSKEDEKLFFEAAEEHALVDLVLAALEKADPASDVFAAKAKVLKDLIEHHAGEEESEMFPRARKLLGADRLVELGEEMTNRGPMSRDNGNSSSRKPVHRNTRVSVRGKAGWILLWLLGIPIPLLLILFLMRGCT